MTIIHTIQGNKVTVAVNGDLDLKTAGPLRESLDSLVERYRDKHLVLDLAEVDFIDSSGLGVILGRYRKLKSQGRALTLVGVKPGVRAVLELAGITTIISVADYVAKGPVKDSRV